MQTIAPAAAPVIIHLHAIRAARTGTQSRRRNDFAARIIMACMALVCLAFASVTLRAAVTNGIAPAPPPHLRAYCASLSGSQPFPYRNCFLTQGN
jgi:hypothetical protein